MPLRSFFATFLAAVLAAPIGAEAPQRPKLVVVVSVDQLSEELVSRWGRDLPGGLGRLCREGTAFLEAYHDHGYTETGPGHSVLLTGRNPMGTGITENMWRDAATGRLTYCVEDPAGRILGPKGPLPGAHGTGPANLRATTLGEWLQAQVPASRSFAVSGKDRAAILMAGHKAQGVFWFNPAAGGWATSTAYASALPAWLRDFDAGFMARIERDSLYWSPLDDKGLPPPASYTVNGRTVTLALPRLVHALGMPLDEAFWNRFRSSPFLDQATLDAAEALAAAERLGRGEGLDLLALSLSATDYVGHRFGNGGPEMRDQLRRLDQALGAWLARLEAQVPGLWVVLTADHGAEDFPERLQAQGIPARRLDPRALRAAFDQDLARRLGGSRPWFLPSGADLQLYLDPEALRLGGHPRAEVLQAAAAAAKALPDVAEALTADELAAFTPDPATPPQDRSLKERIRLSFVPGRSGDLLLALKPFATLDDGEYLADHGSPQDYDRRVPIVFWGPWRAERRTEPVRTVDIAPTLARELGIRPEGPVDGKPLPLAKK